MALLRPHSLPNVLVERMPTRVRLHAQLARLSTILRKAPSIARLYHPVTNTSLTKQPSRFVHTRRTVTGVSPRVKLALMATCAHSKAVTATPGRTVAQRAAGARLASRPSVWAVSLALRSVAQLSPSARHAHPVIIVSRAPLTSRRYRARRADTVKLARPLLRAQLALSMTSSTVGVLLIARRARLVTAVAPRQLVAPSVLRDTIALAVSHRLAYLAPLAPTVTRRRVRGTLMSVCHAHLATTVQRHRPNPPNRL